MLIEAQFLPIDCGRGGVGASWFYRDNWAGQATAVAV